MTQLDESNWNLQYLDAQFDRVIVCVKQVGVNFGVLVNLQLASVR